MILATFYDGDGDTYTGYLVRAERVIWLLGQGEKGDTGYLVRAGSRGLYWLGRDG